MNPILALVAAISGSALLNLVVWVVVLGLIFYLLFWLIGISKIPEPFSTVARVILALVAVVLLINVLLGLVDHSFIRW